MWCDLPMVVLVVVVVVVVVVLVLLLVVVVFSGHSSSSSVDGEGKTRDKKLLRKGLGRRRRPLWRCWRICGSWTPTRCGGKG